MAGGILGTGGGYQRNAMAGMQRASSLEQQRELVNENIQQQNKMRKTQAITGTIQGAASGAAMGSMAGPWGTLAGAVVGTMLGYYQATGDEGVFWKPPEWMLADMLF